MRKPWKQRYTAHINGPYWAELKRKVIKRRGHKCERCDQSECCLDLHHKHYKTFGKERQKDVMLLCRPCHRIEDADRKRLGDAARAWYRLCGEFGGDVSANEIKLLEDVGYISSTGRGGIEREETNANQKA
jgi:hypothetical protein